jgi:hypothetical protein
MGLYRYILPFFLIVLPYRAVSQQQSGTIVVFRALPDHAIVAADSKSVRTCPPNNRIVVRDVCKILTFDNRFVFAASGYYGRHDPCESNDTLWNVGDITKHLYQNDSISSVDDFATKWAKKMGSVLWDDSKISPPAMGPRGIILAAVFLGFSGSRIDARDVVLTPGKQGGVHADVGIIILNGERNFAGEGEVIEEFSASQSRRAKQWHARIDKLGPDEQIVALARLTKQFDTSGTVGGAIDAIRVTPLGIKWLLVKPECDIRRK